MGSEGAQRSRMMTAGYSLDQNERKNISRKKIGTFSWTGMSNGFGGAGSSDNSKVLYSRPL